MIIPENEAARLQLDIPPQLDDSTRGTACLPVVDGYCGDPAPRTIVIDAAPLVETGGTRAALPGNHALRRGDGVRLYTFALATFGRATHPRTAPSASPIPALRIRSPAHTATPRRSTGWVAHACRGASPTVPTLPIDAPRPNLRKKVPAP